MSAEQREKRKNPPKEDPHKIRGKTAKKKTVAAARSSMIANPETAQLSVPPAKKDTVVQYAKMTRRNNPAVPIPKSTKTKPAVPATKQKPAVLAKQNKPIIRRIPTPPSTPSSTPSDNDIDNISMDDIDSDVSIEYDGNDNIRMEELQDEDHIIPPMPPLVRKPRGPNEHGINVLREIQEEVRQLKLQNPDLKHRQAIAIAGANYRERHGTRRARVPKGQKKKKNNRKK